jgi:CBS domain containing-hemolysin-like protein
MNLDKTSACGGACAAACSALTLAAASTPRAVRAAAAGVAVAGLLLAPAAQASFLSGEALDTAADVLAWVVLVIVPIVAITVFWLVHVLPEKIAHKRHHPQRAAIQTLCLLSLVFGGLLWPLAWLWAYTKPIGYKIAYGTEKHEDYFHEAGEKLRAGTLSAEELQHLRDELINVQARGPLPPQLRALLDDVDAALVANERRVAPVEARSA